ncbi:hypothetical protein NHP21005_12490 [Helicobacter sp. NHP21005]|nr:NAD(P)H-dependent oxidoreductase [Helicobacter sp. NHP21005]BEG57561.1 hypothetical protein NHP21005_12490 [Helicobacter sp. NHP21005]
MSLLVILAHPDLAHSRVNKALKEALSSTSVEISDLYAQYPNFDIDIAGEQDKLIKQKAWCFNSPCFGILALPYSSNTLTMC